MIIDFLLFALVPGIIFFLQALIHKIGTPQNSEKNGLPMDYKALILHCFFIGFWGAAVREWLDDTIPFQALVMVVLVSLTISYAFFIAPIFYLWRKKDFVRDTALEKELQGEGFNFKILFSDAFSSNAYCTGGIPNSRLIIVANNLRDHLRREELKAIIYHEIGHHKRYHILKLFFINVAVMLIAFYLFRYILEMGLNTGVEVLMVAVIAAVQGLMIYYVPAKFMVHMEYQADLFAKKHCGEEAVNSALVKLDEISEGKLTKGNITHPNLEKRIRNLQKVG